MIHSAQNGLVTRRNFGLGLASTALLAAATRPPAASAAEAAGKATVHRFEQTEPFPVNAYIIEGRDRTVVVDATLTNAASQALRERVDSLGKPLAAVLLTHPHPDHYAGIGNLVAGLDVPVLAVAGVNDVVRRDDAAKNEVISAMFGDAWPTNRVFPSDIVADGEIVSFGEIELEVRDIGPAESFHDSLFILKGGAPEAFVGDLAYGLMHAYMADNRNPEWKRVLARLRSELSEDTLLHVGHGPIMTPGFLPWQATYLDRFDEAILDADWRDRAAAEAEVEAAMRNHLPTEALLFLMRQSIVPNAQRLGVL